VADEAPAEPLFLPAGALLTPRLPWVRGAPVALPFVLVPVDPPLVQPASSTAHRATRAVRLLRGDADLAGARWVTVGFMTDLQGTTAVTNSTPLGQVPALHRFPSPRFQFGHNPCSQTTDLRAGGGIGQDEAVTLSRPQETRTPAATGGNMVRFALHRQGQSSHVCTRCYAMACRGSLLVLQGGVRLGSRPTVRTLPPATDSRQGFLPAPHDQVSTLGVR